MKCKIVKVTTKAQLDKLYNDSALTLEGLKKQGIIDLIKWLKERTTFTKEIPSIYITKGSFINEMYNLDDKIAYDDDLNFISIIDIDYRPIIVERLKIKAQWFDDIVDNNRIRKYS